MSGERKRIYTHYERSWHWIQTVSILVLLATGFHVHSPVRLPIPGLGAAFPACQQVISQ